MQIVSGDITRDITGEIVYLKAYKQMVGEVTGYSTEKGTATVKLCDTGLEITVSLDDIESTGSTQPHRAFNSEVHILGTRYRSLRSREHIRRRTVMSDLGRCKHTLYILKHKPEYTKGWGWRCRYCGRTYKDLREEAEYKERERRSRTW